MKYYAVAKGKKTGIFETWNECDKQITGFSGAIFKSFKSRKDAEEYIKSSTQLDEISLSENTETPQNKRKVEEVYEKEVNHPEESKTKKVGNYIHIYTDGACTNNGNKNAIAGIGVYFEGKEYNDISKRIDGSQTNNRAELTAIIEAMKTVKSEDNIIIYTDSSYAINGITGKNKRLKNLDLFKISDLLLKTRKGKTIFKKVLGHTGKLDGNHIADSLAVKACQK
jgi:ribonuclease HI